MGAGVTGYTCGHKLVSALSQPGMGEMSVVSLLEVDLYILQQSAINGSMLILKVILGRPVSQVLTALSQSS